MTTSPIPGKARFDPDTTLLTLTQQHLDEWLELLDYGLATHAPTDRLNYCRYQVTRLQLELYRLQNSPGQPH